MKPKSGDFTDGGEAETDSQALRGDVVGRASPCRKEMSAGALFDEGARHDGPQSSLPRRGHDANFDLDLSRGAARLDGTGATVIRSDGPSTVPPMVATPTDTMS